MYGRRALRPYRTITYEQLNNIVRLGARTCGEPNRLCLAPYVERHECAIVMRSMTLLPSEAVGRTANLRTYCDKC